MCSQGLPGSPGATLDTYCVAAQAHHWNGWKYGEALCGKVYQILPGAELETYDVAAIVAPVPRLEPMWHPA